MKKGKHIQTFNEHKSIDDLTKERDEVLRNALNKIKEEDSKEAYDGTTTPKTIGEFLKLLEITATATKADGMVIAGNAELEAERASHVKQLEDMLFDIMAADNIKYTRQYTHMYQ
jgi:hypothetical protein